MTMITLFMIHWEIVLGCYFLFLAYDVVNLLFTLKAERLEEEKDIVSFTNVITPQKRRR